VIPWRVEIEMTVIFRVVSCRTAAGGARASAACNHLGASSMLGACRLAVMGSRLAVPQGFGTAECSSGPLYPRGREARRVRLHRQRHPGGTTERDRHHAPALQRVPEPAGGVRTPRADRTMARHSTTAERAFEMLRDHSQHNGRKLSDVAAAVVESHLLLLPPPPGRIGAADGNSPPLRPELRPPA
jgi:ANTAR domain